jgi:hypothetical protein
MEQPTPTHTGTACFEICEMSRTKRILTGSICHRILSIHKMLLLLFRDIFIWSLDEKLIGRRGFHSMNLAPPDRQSAGVVSGEADAFPSDSPNGRRSRNIKNLKPSLTRAFRKNLGTRRIKKSALIVVKDEEEYRFDTSRRTPTIVSSTNEKHIYIIFYKGNFITLLPPCRLRVAAAAAAAAAAVCYSLCPP